MIGRLSFSPCGCGCSGTVIVTPGGGNDWDSPPEDFGGTCSPVVAVFGARWKANDFGRIDTGEFSNGVITPILGITPGRNPPPNIVSGLSNGFTIDSDAPYYWWLEMKQSSSLESQTDFQVIVSVVNLDAGLLTQAGWFNVNQYQQQNGVFEGVTWPSVNGFPAENLPRQGHNSGGNNNDGAPIIEPQFQPGSPSSYRVGFHFYPTRSKTFFTDGNAELIAWWDDHDVDGIATEPFGTFLPMNFPPGYEMQIKISLIRGNSGLPAPPRGTCYPVGFTPGLPYP